ncbi:hypothetical protein HLB23_00625 [Nocardia uniformis]|uniref:MHYT domain-containing protein n=2 Tax=Nocardia uniformis TaxID=53432 RepID=A0A849C606_9NOCA|nr:hypothetical protein [Nocardia uniformis]
MSFIGSVLGLRCAVHARSSRWPVGWLIAAAVALGGCGIWVMHFTAMLGFAIEGAPIRYNAEMTALSAIIAIVVVWIGLSIAVRVRREFIALPFGGIITGFGVAAMHYLGMYAMHAEAHITYAPGLVTLSLVIAVVAATAALWFMLHIEGFRSTVGAAVIMGIAVCGMHYTGMISMHAHPTDDPSTGGVDPIQLLTPILTTVTLITITLILVVGLAEADAPSRREFSGWEPELAPSVPGSDWPRLTPDRDRGAPGVTGLLASSRATARRSGSPDYTRDRD